ncbi:tryptophan halogenase family protein [Alteromonas sp. BMJM2]|uniref:tryptophan halogenase family protein n=1 Tax=Alteromonas sp. BMJM2 TaxID=2954241 RepID=UPI0022B529E4|nr:tryptophan halogenase family protein [Alteromonas sp. BMJM2]
MKNFPITRIVVVGGGSAGWLTAGRIAAEHQCASSERIQVTLVESPNVPIIGVGEGTWPTMRSTLIKLGISETTFIKECNATFKQGAKFAQWRTGKKDDFYYHPLMLPQGFSKGNLGPYWQTTQDDLGESFSHAVCFQEAICEAGLAPKSIRHAEFAGTANYAYHLDAGKFTQFLTKHCQEKLGVKHILADVSDIVSHENGDIKSLLTQQAITIEGDLFVDCTGFKSKLLGEHFQVPFIPCDDVLFIDRAIAVHVPYEQESSPIASHTISTAQDAGWVWDIGLQSRRGVGYVYSSKHQSQDDAYERLESYVNLDNKGLFNQLKPKEITIKSGHRKCFWQNNCVAVGLSAGFLEPLEASALVLVELSATMIAEQLPANRQVMDLIAKRFNDTFSYRWQRIIDFLKLHYCLSQRDDSEFWRDNRESTSIPESLHELLDLWQYHPPSDLDFTSNNEVFPAASYQYVLYGMGFKTQLQPHQQWVDIHFAKQQLAQNQKVRSMLVEKLPAHRELINKINQFGLQAV